MDVLTFFIRHTPFWAIPSILIFVEFGLIHYKKGNKDLGKTYFKFSVPFFLLLGFYFYAGGPEKSVRVFLDFLDYVSQ